MALPFKFGAGSAEPTRAELDRIESQLNASSTFQAFRSNFGQRRLSDYGKLATALKAEGIALPHDYMMGFDPQGKAIVEKKGFFDRNGWAIPALIIGGTLAGGWALSAVGGSAPAAAAAATGGGVGVGETAAVTGLAGSGFGDGGGAGYTDVPGANYGNTTGPNMPNLPNGGGNGNGGGNSPNVPNPGGFDWQDALTRAGVFGGLMGLGQAFGPDAPAPPVMPQIPTMPEMPPEMREIMALQKQRLEAQNPLYASILQLAKQRMPTSVQNAQLPGGNSAQQTTVQQLGGWGKA